MKYLPFACCLILAACTTVPPQTPIQSKALLEQQLATIAPSVPGRPATFLLVVAGYDQPVPFSSEMRLAAHQLGIAFDANRRTVLLSNARNDSTTLPQAMPDVLDDAIKGLAGKMNLQEDTLAIYMVSHGRYDGAFVLNRQGSPMSTISPAWLRATLNQAEIKWRVVFASACFAGVFDKALADDDTMVMTAADALHPSFGCSNDNQYTYFGRALLDKRDFAHPDWAAIYADTAE
ncbi:Peptidase C13 family protein [Andreprevotia lacus DSM 23236]|jgi:hypothetical protein|uniref:Peptidase C13 family protein n=1 Tax=Andreprevotia lacus DSM 23236 TaxID=1121001 RepID=A0A1W1X9S3_9NEIS|nr:C13 family peptidase [Andreprevotia lacus]SMC20577.1 Peptidase C13 family protein [Andreprevotia lacus DSM 23236]